MAPVRLPAPLAPGDRIAVVAPCSPVLDGQLPQAMAALRGWGFEPVAMAHVGDRRGHLAGTDDTRVADLEAAFRDEELRAVWIARGGYGATRIAERVDWRALGADPKPLIGFSDATALLQAAWRHLRLVTVHGPFASAIPDPATAPRPAEHLRRLLLGRLAPGPLPVESGGPTTISGGAAEGPLLGGNLAVLSAMVGTPQQPDLEEAVVLLEDINEAPYRIDRMLTQLRGAGCLAGIAGVALGAFTGCQPPDNRPSATVDEVLSERLGDLGVPVLAGLPFGHRPDQLALPHGARVRLDADAGEFALLESPTA